MTPSAVPTRAYPVPLTSEDDPRFAGVVAEVGAVLAAHGFPPVASIRDHIALHLTLFDFLYAKEET